jgi:hypothetical protein
LFRGVIKIDIQTPPARLRARLLRSVVEVHMGGGLLMHRWKRAPDIILNTVKGGQGRMGEGNRLKGAKLPAGGGSSSLLRRWARKVSTMIFVPEVDRVLKLMIHRVSSPFRRWARKVSTMILGLEVVRVLKLMIHRESSLLRRCVKGLLG